MTKEELNSLPKKLILEFECSGRGRMFECYYRIYKMQGKKKVYVGLMLANEIADILQEKPKPY